MRRALALARGVWGETQPNPMVGAVLVEDGVIVAEGATAPDGGPHAERRALEALGRLPRPGATLYVTLEPCCTEGRTGACTARILAAGVSRVVVGAVDPNPAHAGRGLEVLRAAGVEVISGVLAEECADLNLIFNHWITHGTPLLAAKVASTLDGKLACRTGDSQWITGEASRADVHRWRRLFPGIGVGAMTVLHDNPRLTVRPPSGVESCPLRFVFDGLLRTVVEKNLPRLFTDEFRGRTIVVTTPHGGLGYVRKLRDLGVQVWVIDSPSQRVPFAAFRRRYRELDLLLIDDIHFLSGKDSTQEEFFHTFNELHNNHKQVVLTSDRPASEIAKLSERLVSRFQWGMVASIQAPGLETRIAILRKKALARGLELTPEIAEFIASRIARNVRNLEGAITRIFGLTGMTRKPLELAQVEKLLHDILVEEASHTLTVEVIQRKVAEHYRIQMSDMTSKRRMQNIAFPRQVAMYLTTQLTGMSLVSIGQSFGGRDHGTVIHARKTVGNQMEVDANVRRTVEYLRAQLSTNCA